VECSRSDLNNLEAEYVLKFTPRLNKDFPSCNRFVSAGALKLRGLGRFKFKSYIAATSHYRYRFLDYTYYNLKALALDQVFLDLLASEGISHWW